MKENCSKRKKTTPEIYSSMNTIYFFQQYLFKPKWGWPSMQDKTGRTLTNIRENFEEIRSRGVKTGWRWTTGDGGATKSEKHRLCFTRGKSPGDTSACLSRVFAENRPRRHVGVVAVCRASYIARRFYFTYGEDCSSLAVSSRGTLFIAKLAKLRRIIPHSCTGIRSNQENA